eukprot:1080531-Pyramimonas_sp.AAC.1
MDSRCQQRAPIHLLVDSACEDLLVQRLGAVQDTEVHSSVTTHWVQGHPREAQERPREGKVPDKAVDEVHEGSNSAVAELRLD